MKHIATVAILHLGLVAPSAAEVCPNCAVPIGTNIPCKPTEALIVPGVAPGSGVQCHVTADVRLTRSAPAVIRRGSLLVGKIIEMETKGRLFSKRTTVMIEFHELIEEDADPCVQPIEGVLAGLQTGFRRAKVHEGGLQSKGGGLKLLLPKKNPKLHIPAETTLWVKTRSDVVLRSCHEDTIDLETPTAPCPAGPAEARKAGGGGR